jgi:hypothetical protein
MVKIKFLENFAGKLAGEVFECDSMLASHLVRVDLVAEFVSTEVKEVKKKTTPKKD